MPDLREKVLSMGDGMSEQPIMRVLFRDFALTVAALVAEDCARACHTYAMDQRIHKLAARGAYDCAAAIRARAKTLGANA